MHIAAGRRYDMGHMRQISDPLRLTLTGFGQLAREVHVPILRRMKGVRLIAIADIQATRREEAHRLWPEARVYESQEEMLASSPCDGVIISASPAVHAVLALGAIQKAKHVYLEKPAASTLADAARLVETWRGSGLVGMMGFNYRFSRAIESMRVKLQAGCVGRIRIIRSAFSAPARVLPEWKASRGTGGGALLDLGSHHIDLFRYLCGSEIETVQAHIRSEHTEDDSVVLQMTMRSGIAIQSFFSLGAIEEDIIEVYGDAGKLTVDRHGLEDVQFTSPSFKRARLQRFAHQLARVTPRPGWWKKLRSPWHEPSYEATLTQFVAAMRGQATSQYPDLENGWRCQVVLDAAERSAHAGMPISCGEEANV